MAIDRESQRGTRDALFKGTVDGVDRKNVCIDSFRFFSEKV
jgi:hypothetical protein